MKVEELVKLCRYDIDEDLHYDDIADLRKDEEYMYLKAREEYDYLEQLQDKVMDVFLMLIKYVQHADLRKDENYINWIYGELHYIHSLINYKEDGEYKELFLDFIDEDYIKDQLFSFFDIRKGDPLYANLTVDYLIVQGKYKQFLVDHNENTELHDRIWLM